jgi:nucleoside-diphosphate-sugar epimerase
MPVPKILITGADSFVGNSFKKYSVFKDIEEISLLKYETGEIDFTKYNVVLHLAAIVHRTDKISLEKYMKVNRDLCLDVAEKAKVSGVNLFIFMSTIKVYGDEDTKVVRDEESVCNPDDAYGKSKLEAESGLRRLQNEKFKVAIIRSPLIYGEGVKANMLKIIKLIDFCPVLPFDKIENRRNYTYIENLTGIIDRIIEIDASGTFIVMDEKAISTTELIRCISKSLGKKVFLFKLPVQLIKVGKYVLPGFFSRLFGSDEYDNRRTLQNLTYNPPYSTEEGIRRMVKYYMTSKYYF